MHDLKTVRDDPRAFDAALQRRGLPPHADAILDLDRKHRALIQRVQELQARRNDAAKRIGALKAKGQNADDLIAETQRIKSELPQLEQQEREAAAAVQAPLDSLPNIPASDVPVGADPSANKEVRRWGEPRKFDFPVKDHVALGEKLGMDIPTAARMSGARFTLLKGPLARLERALAQFMLDLHTREYGYTEVSPPLMVRENAAYGTGNLPKFREDLFSAEMATSKTENAIRDDLDAILQAELARQKTQPPNTGKEWQVFISGSFASVGSVMAKAVTQGIKEDRYVENFYLIPTAEMSLTNIVADQVLNEEKLPLRFTAFTPCFRSEAGAAGKDTHGMLRQHQFYKVELVSVTHPDKSEDEHQRMTACAEEVLKRLGLPYRTVVLCTGDMGFAARKTYDIEVWLPGQNAYREISSCSNCGEFQARRMKARFRRKDGKGTRFVHTLNGSGLAVGRTLIAVLENFQNKDGSVTIPKALVPNMGGMEALTP
ncbi:MAG: serine--tRNA ligase [Rhodospirillales bacterium]